MAPEEIGAEDSKSGFLVFGYSCSPAKETPHEEGRSNMVLVERLMAATGSKKDEPDLHPQALQ